MTLIKVKSRGTDNVSGRRNLIINGAMQVSQRGSTFTAPNSAYTLDRFQVYQANGAVFDIKTSTDSPDGFESSLEIDCTTAAASPAAGAYFEMAHRIEGYNVQQLAYGTSSAKKITLSFYVKSNKTGTYQVNFRSSSANQMANKTYTINSADTWERKSVTVDGATGFSLTGGNAEGLMIDWWYHSGSSYASGSGSETYITLAASNYNANATANLGDNTSNYLRMTGVQLEVGDSASDFEHEPFERTLAKCLRYFHRLDTSSADYLAFSAGGVYGGTTALTEYKPSVPMRIEPTLGTNGLNSANFVIVTNNTTKQISSLLVTGSNDGIRLNVTPTSSMTVGDYAYLQLNDDKYLEFIAEL